MNIVIHKTRSMTKRHIYMETRPFGPSRCAVSIVKRMRYPTNQPTDQPTDTARRTQGCFGAAKNDNLNTCIQCKEREHKRLCIHSLNVVSGNFAHRVHGSLLRGIRQSRPIVLNFLQNKIKEIKVAKALDGQRYPSPA